MRNKFLLFCGFFIIHCAGWAQDIPLEPGYTDYDKHKAVITCMQYIYVEKHQQAPAEEDVFPLCEQRFLALSRTLSHDDFVKALAASDEQLLKIYYDTLFGIPSEPIPADTPSIPRALEAPTVPNSN